MDGLRLDGRRPMEPKPRNALLFTTLIFYLCTSSSSASLQYQTQTLVLNSLPTPQTLSWPESESLDSTEPNLDSTSTLQLHHVDSLSFSFNKTPEQLFHLRLQRDALRAEALATVNSGKGFSSSVYLSPGKRSTRGVHSSQIRVRNATPRVTQSSTQPNPDPMLGSHVGHPCAASSTLPVATNARRVSTKFPMEMDL
uniref:Uncharacterized protein n=1 Tax=Fagus sylvatica TaxID=28930 RepID=A0A2N9HLY6_FAGSY